MVYGLPAAGEANWDVKLNASLDALKAEQDGRLSDASLSATYVSEQRIRTQSYAYDQGPVWVFPGDMLTFTGSPTLATANEAPGWALGDAATAGLFAYQALPTDWTGSFDVFVWYSNPNAGSGNCRIGYAVGQHGEGDTITGIGGGTVFETVNAPALNVITRHQIAKGVTLADYTPARVRFNRYGADAADTLVGNLIVHAFELVPRMAVPARIPFATVTDVAGATITKHATPFDGERPASGLSIYTPIWSTASHIFVCEPSDRGATAQTRAARLSKTYTVEQDVQVATGAHDVQAGHRFASIAVTDGGTVHVHPEVHHQPWAGKHSTAANDLTALVATPTPAGSGTNSSYRRYFRNPHDNSLWLVQRGDAYTGRIYKWNTGTNVWDVKGANPIAADNGAAYGLELAFTASTVYMVTEWRTTSSGYPRRDIGVVKSTDDGATWKSVPGSPVPLPVGGMRQTSVFPSPAGDHTGVLACIGINAAGNPVVVAAWKHPDESYRSLWAATYNPTTKRFDLTRVLKHPDGWNIGNPRLAYTATGGIAVTVADYDDHTTDNQELTAAQYPTGGKLWLLTTTDGAAWNRHQLDAGGGYSGAFIDQESMRLDNLWRILPVSIANPSESKVWAVTLP